MDPKSTHLSPHLSPSGQAFESVPEVRQLMTGVPAVKLDSVGTVLDANDAFGELLDLQAACVVGLRFSKLADGLIQQNPIGFRPVEYAELHRPDGSGRRPCAWFTQALEDGGYCCVFQSLPQGPASESSPDHLRMVIQRQQQALEQAETLAEIRMASLVEANQQLDRSVWDRTKALQHQLDLEQIVIQAAFEILRAGPDELPDALDRNMDRVAIATDLDRITIYQKNADEKTVCIPHELCRGQTRSAKESMSGTLLVEDFRPLEEHLLKHNILLINDVAHFCDMDPKFGTLGRFIRGGGGRSMLMVPFLIDGQMVGLINFVRIKQREFSETHIRFLQSIAVVISYALTAEETWRRRKESEEKVAQSIRLEALGVLAGGIAHDFNNILTAIIGTTELLSMDMEKGTLPQELEHAPAMLNETLIASQRARELIKQILTFSRTSDAEREPTRLQEIVEEVLVLVRASIPSSIEIDEQLDAPDATIFADSTQLHQVVLNLCTNAYQAMGAKGTLSITLQEVEQCERLDPVGEWGDCLSGPHVRLVIHDDGPGIPEEIQARIFDPFFTTKGVGEGTGMGLAVVHGIVTSHEGTIHFTSREGEGATFEICLPLYEGAVAKEVETAEADKQELRQFKIIIVDDEPSVAFVTRSLLEARGHQVTVFDRPHDCLAHLESCGDVPDLILTDLSMPDLNGLELSSAVRKQFPELPILICTGHNEVENDEQMKELNAHLLKKPFMREQLYQAVDGLV